MMSGNFHMCVNRTPNEKDPWFRIYDAQGIYLCKACELCEREQLARFRPEILSGYGQKDVDEDIEPEDSDGGW